MLGQTPKPEELDEKYSDKFNKDEFFVKLKKVGKSLGCTAVKHALMLYYAMLSHNVPVKYKAMIAGALGYFGFPLDAIPDIIPAIGYTDDVAVMSTVVAIVVMMMDAESKAKATETLQEWFPESC